MVVETGFKKTEIGVIPENWNSIGIQDLINNNFIVGHLDGNHGALYPRSNEFIETGVPYIGANDFYNGRVLFSNCKYLSLHRASVFRKGIAIDGDVLFAHNATVGPVALLRTNFDFVILSTTATYFRCNSDKILNLYLLYFLQSQNFIKQFSAVMAQSTRNQIPITAQRKLTVILPPLPEQTAIANALSDMDALIAQTEKLMEKKKAIKQGVMQELLKPKEGWVTKKLGEVCDIIMGQSPLSEYYNFEGIGLPLIQGNADIKNRKTITRTYSSNITKKGKLGDIIMTVRAPVGEIALSTFECCLGRGVCALRYDNDFMYHYLISIENYWSRLSSGSTFDSVNSSQIRDLSVTLPQSKNEQIEIAITLTELDKDIELTETKLQKLKHQKQGMMQALLTGKIRLI